MLQKRKSLVAGLTLFAAATLAPQVTFAPALASPDNGVVTLTSAYSVEETIARFKADVAAKGIKFFDEIDQSGLGRAAGIEVNDSKLLIFGNPPLGVTFITANPEAGLDWPVRVLVFKTADGAVHVAYNDFAAIARRHNITNREAEFAKATEVIRSITGTVAK